jgi:hypothetical protein
VLTFAPNQSVDHGINELIVPEFGLVENEVSTEDLLPAHRGATISHEII